MNETIYHSGEAPVTRAYQLRLQVVDSFPNPDGTHTYVISRTERDSENESWESAGRWSAILTDRELTVREGNTPFVKLIFPLRKGLSWDGNRYNTLGADQFEVAEYDVPAVVGEYDFPFTLNVVQEKNDDVIVFYDERTETYARGVGLVRRVVKQLHYCTEDDCVGQQQVDNGIEYIQELINYGEE